MNAPPPIPEICGSTRSSTSCTAIAASIAVPPCRRIRVARVDRQRIRRRHHELAGRDRAPSVGQPVDASGDAGGACCARRRPRRAQGTRKRRSPRQGRRSLRRRSSIAPIDAANGEHEASSEADRQRSAAAFRQGLAARAGPSFRRGAPHPRRARRLLGLLHFDAVPDDSGAADAERIAYGIARSFASSWFCSSRRLRRGSRRSPPCSRSWPSPWRLPP